RSARCTRVGERGEQAGLGSEGRREAAAPSLPDSTRSPHRGRGGPVSENEIPGSSGEDEPRGGSMEAVATAPAPQHMRALQQANRVRLARAELKRQVAQGELTAAEVVQN